MKFKFEISKWANFYFFVANLSEWHFSYRLPYNELWKKELGGFFKNEIEKLNSFANLHKKYHFGRDFFGQVFFINKNPLAILKKTLPEKDFTLLKEIFTLLLPHFNKIYKKDLPCLNKWEINLDKHLNNISLIGKFNSLLSRLYHTKPLTKNITIYLLLSGLHYNGGGANMDGKSISLEISRYPFHATNQAVGIIWHELIHLYFETRYFIPLLSNKWQREEAIISLIKETAASSLLPNGVLGKKILKIKSEILNGAIPQKYNKPLLDLTNSYTKKNRFFDEQFAEKIYTIVSDLKGRLQ